MFKLESYITPILLSYVHKYIKNFKPEDSQLSLWGGEVALHNLDLRLEVLEDELQLPFTFVSGHIHELIIHVPWTKLYSEPICITINTIECILKLRDKDSSSLDGGGNAGGLKDRRRRPNKATDTVAPPGYVQTMVNKIVSNITINCCNLIVKYVEEDIVMSMNVKNLIFQSANDKWEPEFSDFLTAQLMLRKIIKLTDVTVCLDKRNASGKIDSYQEPVLYRCSVLMRWLRCYNSASTHRASVSKLDIHCQSMTFNISEVQVPMMMRLLLLARALQNREVGQRPIETDSNIEVEEGDENSLESFEQESWTGWAWNLVPSLPSWSEDWTGDGTEDRGMTFHSGIYIDDLAFNFRVGDSGSHEKNAWKNKVEPFLTLALRGCLLDYICHDNVWVNSQLGICSIQLRPVGLCSCGVNEAVEDKDISYFESGSYLENYFSESLFSTTAIENCGEKRRYNFSWDMHQNIFSESNLLEKTAALAVDYLYMVELTENYNIEKIMSLNGDLEYSDLPEHALCRSVMGPFVLRVNSGLLHRMDKLRQAAALYDYQPYSTPPPEDRRDTLPAVTTEEYDSLEENIPLRTYQYTLFQPKVEFYIADHPNTPCNFKRKTSSGQAEGSVQHKVSFLCVESQCIDARFISPMYPRRLVRSACLLPSLPQHMFHACHSHTISRILGLTCHVSVSNQSKYEVFFINNLLYKSKELFHTHLWEGNDLLYQQCSIESESTKLTATKAQMLIAYQIVSSLVDRKAPSTLVNEMTPEGRILEVVWENVNWQKGLTKLTRCDSLTVAEIKAALVLPHSCDFEQPETTKIIIFCCAEEKKGQQGALPNPFIKACLQWSQQVSLQSHAPLLVVSIKEALCNVDPIFYAWLLHIPSTISSANSSKVTTSRTSFAATDSNIQSVRSGHRKISDISGSQTCERNRRSQTPMSVHSSDKDRETAPPAPLVSQLSGISVEQALVDSKAPTPEAWELSKWLVRWFPVWQGLVINVDVAHWQINMPTLSLTKPDISLTDSAPTADQVCIRLPVLQISSASSHKNSQPAISHPSKIPVQLPASTWTEGCSNFPWNVSLSELSLWILCSGTRQYLLKPVTTKCTVGISTRFATSEKEIITSLGLCIHNDTGALQISVNQTQAQVLSNVLLNLMVVIRSLYTQNCASAPVVAPTIPMAPPSPTTISESASFSEPRNLVKNISEPTHAVEEPVKLSVWLQWTLARMGVYFYQHCENAEGSYKCTKLALEVEDLMSALDLQHVYSKLKLKIASANVHHFTRPSNVKTWQLSPYQGIVMCGYEEIVPPSSGQVTADEGCGLLTATLTRAKCRSVHSRWGAPLSGNTSTKRCTDVKVPSPSASFITEILVKLQPLDFLVCVETLDELSTILHPFIILLEEYNKSPSHLAKATAVHSPGLPSISSVSLPLLYLDFQAVRILMPVREAYGFHDTLIIQVDSVILSPHAENPIIRTPIRPDVFHMAEQARILTVPGSEVEDRQYDLNVTGLAISTGQWQDIQRCRKLTSSTASSLRTMSENPALVWNSIGSNTQTDASEIVGSPKPNLMFVLAPLKICVVCAPAIVYHRKVLVCGHAVEIYAVSDVDIKLTTNQICLIGNLLSEVQNVLFNFLSKSDKLKPCEPSFVLELAEKQYFSRLQSVYEIIPHEHIQLDSGIDTADISSIDTLQSSKTRGARRVSRSPRYLESVHGPSVHSFPLSHSSSWKVERETSSFPSKAVSEPPSDFLASSRSNLQKEKSLIKSDQISSRERPVDVPFDLLITAGKISLMLHEDVNAETSNEIQHNELSRRPLLYSLVTQPHFFYSQFSRSCSIQVSLYNALVNLGSPHKIVGFQPSFSESDFPVTIFESRKGELDAKTGVPPALFKGQWTSSATKPAQVSVDISRPAKVTLSTVNLEFLHYILKTLSSVTDSSCSSSNAFEPDPAKKSIHQTLDTLSGISSIRFKSTQIVLALQAENEEHRSSVMEISVVSVSGDLLCTSRTRWGCNVSAVERIVFLLNPEGLCLSLSHHLAHQLFLEPCNVQLRLELSWPAWLPRNLRNTLPHTQLTVQSDYVSVRIGPDHIKCLSIIWEAYMKLSGVAQSVSYEDPPSFQHMSPSTPASEVHSNETDFVDTEQHYTDDLRTGAFQFMDATNTLERDQIPLPYQCVFWESSPPAIAWRYPQPRSLTNVMIFPVPFKGDKGADIGKEDAPVVVCSLQYWSECRAAYQHYATFLLSETNESNVELPSSPSSAVSAVWRVLLAGTRDIHGPDLSMSDSEISDSLTSEIPVVSPRALAACMRIDSFFSASLSPNTQACLNMTFIQVSLINQQPDYKGNIMPLELEDYSLDGKIPNNYGVLWLSLNHFSSFYSAWPEGRQVGELNGVAQLDVLDHTNLSRQCVIEPFLFKSCMSLSTESLADISLVTRPITIRLGPAVTHTIAVSTRLWQQEFFPISVNPSQVIVSQYILCNNTVLPIVFAQVDSEEQILLLSKQSHMYSWRSISKKPLLHVSVVDPSINQLGKEAWSSHFSIDSVGTHICKIRVQVDREIIMFVKVAELLATQKLVTFSGQLQVLNQVNQMLDLRLIRPASDWSMEACNCVVPLQPNGKALSLFLDRHSDDPQLAIRLRIRQVDNSLWTGDIPLKENPKTYQPWLVKVPLQERHQFICIWCRVIRENVNGQQKILVLLSPMYAIRSCLPTSVSVVVSNDQTSERQDAFEVKGNGEVTPLHLSGGLKENTYQLHIRSAANVKIFPFGYSCIDPKEIFLNLEQVNIDEVIENSTKTKKIDWPLPHGELSYIEWIGIEIENSYVQASHCPLSPYCGTLVLELQPWALLLNMLQCDISIEQSGDLLFFLPSKGIVAPPKLEGTFCLGLKFHEPEEYFLSEALLLARAEWSKSFYMPRIAGLIPLDGHTQLSVKCGFTALSLLTVKSQSHNEVRVVTICSSFVVNNSSSVPLQVTAIAVRHSDLSSRLDVPRKDNPDARYATITIYPDHKHKGYPLEKWMHINSCDAEIVPYICVSMEGGKELSCPLRISGFPLRRRFIVPMVQDMEKEPHSVGFKSFVLSVVESNGQTFLSIADEPYPQIFLHNASDFRILCAEAIPNGKASSSDFKIKIDAVPWNWHCAVDPHCKVGYNTLSADEVFPQILPTPSNCYVALAVDINGPKSVCTTSWSPALQLSGKQEQFTSIPGCGDVKVHTWAEGYTTHLFIESVSRVEICARDIRSRLSAIPNSSLLPSELDEVASPEIVLPTSTVDHGLSQCKEDDLDSIHTLYAEKKSFAKLNIFIQSCCLTLTSPTTLSDEVEVSTLTLDNIAVTFSPLVPSAARHLLSEVSLQITLGDLQLDNQLYEHGGFDFPVVLMAQQDKDVNRKKDPLPLNFNAPASLLVNKFSPQALLAINIILESGADGLTPKSVHLSIGPITSYVEDKYVMELKRYIAVLLSPILTVGYGNWDSISFLPSQSAWVPLPFRAVLELQVLKRPLRLTSLTLDPVWLLLSVHSSMRLYIALDRSPLQFTQFCRRSVFTTSYNLGHTLSMHYLSGAIFGAGWVVSSLELFGSPGGFARTLSTGLRDFVSLPYHGILEGPWGFLVGVTHGSASLMKHFTAGTLTSVTKMASSVARNLDRLTLDAEHLERTEELRRVRPQGVAQGLLQGLTGLGISILGAVGGLAHHPLQAVLSAQPSPRGVVTGVGRGLVGVFTKPLSGAADLVAMTGQGLLQGAGWSNLPAPRHQSRSERSRSQGSALIKFGSKIPFLSSTHCLLVVEATLEYNTARFKAVTLMLTSESIVVISADGDSIESQMSLVEIVLPECDADPTMLTISFKGAPPVVDQRMWDFVNGCLYAVSTGPPALETSEDVRPASPIPLSSSLPLSMQTAEHQSTPEVEDVNPNLNLSSSSSDDEGVSLSAVQPAETTASSKVRPPLIFHVSPQIRSHFLILAKVAQKQMDCQGFQVL